jgi:hypothetical protein
LRWAIEIQKTSLDKRNLADLLQGLGFGLIEGIEYPALASPIIDVCATAADVFEVAKGIRSAFKGPAQVDSEFMLGSVIDFSTNPPRRHAFLEVASCAMAMTVGAATLTVSPPIGLSSVELERWSAEYAERKYQAQLEEQRSRLEPAFLNPRAAKVLELLSIENPSAEAVYKIYELSEGHPGNRVEFHKRFEISSDEFNRFSDAIHNPSVSGDWARHAYHRNPKTENPMSQGEAETFVRNIATHWLNSLRRAHQGS